MLQSHKKTKSIHLMNLFQQLATFARVWYLFDAKWQCPHLSGERIARILRGEHKPIYYPGGKLNLK